MLLLTSNGLSSESMMKKIKSLFTGLSKAVMVTTASIGYKEKDRHIPRLKAELHSLGRLTISILTLTTLQNYCSMMW